LTTLSEEINEIGKPQPGMGRKLLVARSASARTERRRFHAPGRILHIAAYSVALLAVAAVLDQVMDSGAATSRFSPGFSPPTLISGWLGFVILTVVFFASEALILHLHIGHSGYVFSLTETALVVALFHASPRIALGAQLLGSLGALIFVRRQRDIKTLFNMALFAFSNRIGFLVFETLSDGSAPHQTYGAWATAYVSVFVYSITSVLVVFGVIAIAQKTANVRTLASNLGVAAITSIATGGLGIAAATLVATVWPAALLLIFPIVAVFLANREVLAERRRNDELLFLQASSKTLTSDSPEGSIPTVLEAAREEFAVALVEFHSPWMLRTRIVRATHTNGPIVIDNLDSEHSLLPIAPPVAMIVDSRSGTELSVYLRSRNLSSAIIVPVFNGNSRAGVLLVADPLSHHGRLDEADLRNVEHLAHHVGRAIETGSLERSVDELREMEALLVHQLQYDTLTGLLNRSAFGRRVREAVDREGTSGSGAPMFDAGTLLFIDLDEFKAVNDTYGHANGDHLLREIARRIQQAVESSALVARLGGDEFVVFVGLADSGQPQDIAARIKQSIGQPFQVSIGVTIFPSASVGTARLRSTDDFETVLALADQAMYQQKRARKLAHAKSAV
jgi:diguanylate cyclase (GGDEF)-like protein